MSFLSFLPFRFLRQKSKSGNPKTQQPYSTVAKSGQRPTSTVTIEKLPVEIQQHVASFLEPDSTACLTLCSRSLQRAIGQQSWFALRTAEQKKTRLGFLIVLQKDLREWLLCYHCEKLHPFDLKTYLYTPWLFWNEHLCVRADGFVYLLPMFGLRFQYAQMIMKLHQLRATKNIFLDSLSHAHSSVYKQHLSHSHVSARIANDHLLVKLEWRILLHRGEGFRYISSLCQNVCAHWTCVLDDDNLSKRIRCQMSHRPGQSCPDCTGMIHCQRCSTEIIVAFLDSNWSSEGQAVYITAWKNLGPCDTPFDIRWRTQVWPIYSSLSTRTLSTPFVPGSILRAFEDVGDSRIGVDGLSSKWPLDSDVEFFKLVADIRK